MNKFLGGFIGGITRADSPSKQVWMNVTGIPEVDRMLSGLELKYQRKALRKGTRRAAHLVKTRAEQRVPIDTGTLYDTLSVRALRVKRYTLGHMVVHVERKTTDDPWYAFFVAFGTKFMEPDRYIQEALYGARDEVIQIAREEIARETPFIAAEARKQRGSFVAGGVTYHEWREERL